MAEFLPQNVLDAIAEKISLHLDDVAPGLGASGQVSTISATFPLWMLVGNKAVDEKNDLLPLMKNLGVWHHQIDSGGVPVAYARTKPLGATADSWSLRELSGSPLAKQIEDAVSWVKKNVQGNYTVRLLSVPAYNVTAFFLFDEANTTDQKVVVVSAPPSFKSLVTQKTYTNKEFLEALSVTPPIQGIVE